MKSAKFVCLGLARWMGLFSFLLVGFLIFRYFNRYWELGIDSPQDINWHDTKTNVTMVTAFIGAFIAFLLDKGIGRYIPVKNRRASSIIGDLWIYFFVTVTVWLPASFILRAFNLSIQFDELVKTNGVAFLGVALLISLAWGELNALSQQLSMEFQLRAKYRWHYFFLAFVPIILGISAGVIQTWAFHFHPFLIVIGGLAGAVSSFIIMALAMSLKVIDERARREDD